MNFCCAAGNCKHCVARLEQSNRIYSIMGNLPLLKKRIADGDENAVHDALSLIDITTLLVVFEAAVAYRESEHAYDSHCSAGDHDNCTARQALEQLESTIGGPRPPLT